MNVKALIEALKAMPPEAEVMHLWDGEARTIIEHVWLAVGGHVVTADCDEVCYQDEDRPTGGPTQAEARAWRTPACDRQQKEDHP